jgi:hypothetical protein
VRGSKLVAAKDSQSERGIGRNPKKIEISDEDRVRRRHGETVTVMRHDERYESFDKMTDELLHAHSKSIARLIECTRNTLRQTPRRPECEQSHSCIEIEHHRYYSQHGELKSSRSRDDSASS